MDLYCFYHGQPTFQLAILEKWPTFKLAIAKELSLSSKFIKLIDKLFILEEEYHNQCQTVDEKQRRLKESKAILDEYFTLASSSLNSSDEALRKAINYSLE